MRNGENKELYDAKVDCLYCGKTFTTKKVLYDAIKVKKRESDHHVYYDSTNPTWYDVYVCPHCGFAFVPSFKELSSYEKKILKKNYIDKVRGYRRYCGERSVEDVVRIYQMALYAAELSEKPNIVIAGLSLKLAWIYRECGNREKEIRFTETALTFYEKEYEHGYEENVDSLLYIIAELNIRLDNYEKAKKWVNVIFSGRNVSSSVKSQIRDRWLDYKEYKEVQALQEKGMHVNTQA